MNYLAIYSSSVSTLHNEMTSKCFWRLEFQFTKMLTHFAKDTSVSLQWRVTMRLGLFPWIELVKANDLAQLQKSVKLLPFWIFCCLLVCKMITIVRACYWQNVLSFVSFLDFVLFVSL